MKALVAHPHFRAKVDYGALVAAFLTKPLNFDKLVVDLRQYFPELKSDLPTHQIR